MEAIKKSVADEESAFEKGSQEMFDKINISPEQFEKTQAEIMQDQAMQMQLFNLSVGMEKSGGVAPPELTKAKTVELVKASNDFAFDLFKKEFIDQLMQDPMMMPVIISSIAHDWVFTEHKYNEDQFKAALFLHKIYEDPSVAMHMQQK